MFAELNLAIPLWAYRQPPAGLSAEWERVYRILVDPVTVAATFRAQLDGAHHGTCELLEGWSERLSSSEGAARQLLPHLHGRALTTWEVGEAIRNAITPIRTALWSAVRFLTHPEPTLNGPEATASALRSDLADHLSRFDARSLLDMLAAAVVSDRDKKLGLPPLDLGSVGQSQDADMSRGRAEKMAKRSGGRPSLEKSNPIKFQVYQRILKEKEAGKRRKEILNCLKNDKDFMEQISDTKLSLDSRLLKNAIAFSKQPKRAQSRKNQETPSG